MPGLLNDIIAIDICGDTIVGASGSVMVVPVSPVSIKSLATQTGVKPILTSHENVTVCAYISYGMVHTAEKS